MSVALADMVVIVHFFFILFVIAGGLLVVLWPRVAWLHLPAAAWGAAIEFGGWICPLTPLEQRLRLQGGADAYAATFTERYLVPLVYPEALTRELQIAIGLVVIAVNIAIYCYAIRRNRARTG